MRKSVEMKKQLDALKNEIKTLQAAGKVNEAHSKLDELNTMKNAVTVQEAIEQVNVTEPFEAVAYAGDLSHFKNVPAAIKNRVEPEKNKNEQKQREIDITLALI